MSQVSLPMRIALAVTLAFFAIWFVALRPKPPAAGPTPAPTPAAAPQSAPGQAAAKAQEAVGASQKAAEKHEGAAGTAATPGTDSATGKAATAQTATKDGAAQPGSALDVKNAKLSEPARAVMADIVDGKVAVLLFWDKRLSDDRAVHQAVKGLSRRGGKVAIHVAPIGELAQYEPITRGVPVVTSPTVLVIDRAGQGRAVGGLSVPSELEELVGKALKVKP